MKNRLLDKRMPTLFGLLLVIIGVGLTSYLVSKGAIFKTHATPSQEPQKIKIANISDTSFTVTYETIDNVFGSVNYGASPTLGQTALDDRDSVSRAVVPHAVHSISVNNLDPSTTYYFSITSAESKYDNGNKPFSITTAPQIAAPPSDQKPATGKVLRSDSSPPSEGIVYLFSDDTQLISALTKSDGSYLLPLNSLRTKNLSSYAILGATTKLKIVAQGNNQASNVVINADQINPVPTITLSNNYDFTSSETPISSESATQASSSGFPTFDDGGSTLTPTIISPKADEGFSDNQPTFNGTAQPNETVDIEIHSDSAISTSVTSDSAGKWTYRPTQPLSSGDHTVTIKTKDPSGIIKTITQSFTVYAQGSQFATSPGPTGFSSPSPIPTITPTPSPIPTQAPIITPPTASASPLLIPTPTPVLITYTPAPMNNLPPTGFSALQFGLLGILMTIVGGIFLFYNTRKVSS